MSDYLYYLMPLFFIAGLVLRVIKLLKEKGIIPNSEQFVHYGMMLGFATAIILSIIQKERMSIIFYSIGEVLTLSALVISKHNKENEDE